MFGPNIEPIVDWLKEQLRIQRDRNSETDAWQASSLRKIAASQGITLDPDPDFKSLGLIFSDPPKI